MCPKARKLALVALMVLCTLATGEVAAQPAGGRPSPTKAPHPTSARRSSVSSRHATTSQPPSKNKNSPARRQSLLESHASQAGASRADTGTRARARSQEARQGRSRASSDSEPADVAAESTSVASGLTDRRSRVADSKGKVWQTIKTTLTGWTRRSRTTTGALAMAPAPPASFKPVTPERLRELRKSDGVMAKAALKAAKEDEMEKEIVRVRDITVECKYERGVDKQKMVRILKKVLDKMEAYNLPKSMKIVFSSQAGVQNATYLGDEDGNASTLVVFGSKLGNEPAKNPPEPGVAHRFTGEQRTESIMGHEFIHVADGQEEPTGQKGPNGPYWTVKHLNQRALVGAAPPDSAQSISAYARRDRNEFVAEAGTYKLMYGRLPPQVQQDYEAAGGPMPTQRGLPPVTKSRDFADF